MGNTEIFMKTLIINHECICLYLPYAFFPTIVITDLVMYISVIKDAL